MILSWFRKIEERKRQQKLVLDDLEALFDHENEESWILVDFDRSPRQGGKKIGECKTMHDQLLGCGGWTGTSMSGLLRGGTSGSPSAAGPITCECLLANRSAL